MARRRRSTALARRTRRSSGPSAAYLKMKSKAEAATRRASKLRRETKGRAGALKTGFTVVAGGALGGAANALAPAGFSVMGAAPDAAVAIGLLAIGIQQNKATPILMAAGIGASYAADWAGDLVEGIQAGESPLTAAMGG